MQHGAVVAIDTNNNISAVPRNDRAWVPPPLVVICQSHRRVGDPSHGERHAVHPYGTVNIRGWALRARVCCRQRLQLEMEVDDFIYVDRWAIVGLS